MYKLRKITTSMLPFKWLMPYSATMWSGVSNEVMLKKKSNKTCCNQNMSALPILRWYVELLDIKFFSATHQGFPNSERVHLTQVGIVTFKYFFTYLLSDAQHPKMRISWAAIIFKCFKLPNPFYSFYLTWDNINSYTTLYHSVQYHTMLY